MLTPLRLLLVEDTPGDADLVLRQLNRGGFDVHHQRVEDGPQLKAALADQEWDLVISDYNLPQFGAQAALETLKAGDHDIPFIAISGAVGEEAAVELMRAGAHDFISKDRLARLVPAVERELREAKSRHARRAAELALRASEERFRHVFDHSPICLALLSIPEGRIIDVNAVGPTYFGYSREEAVGRTSTELKLWADPADRDRYLSLLRASGTVQGFEARLRRKDGSLFTVLYSGTLVTIAGRPYSLNAIQDISARRQAEASLRESESRFRSVFDASPIPILLSAVPDGRLVEVNESALSSFGYTRSEVLNHTTLALGIWVRPEQRIEFFRRIAAEKSLQGFEAVMRTKAGDERVMLCTGTLVTISGQPCALTSAVDITALRHAEAEKTRIQERLHQNQKYEALGTLAGGVAHDFNNILTGVINYTELASEDCPPDHPLLKEFLGEVLKCGLRAKELVRQILLFSRAEEGRQEPVLLQVILKEAIALLRSTLPATTSIETDLDRNAPTILGNATQLHQVVMNLGINASHALKGQPGRLFIRLHTVQLDEHAIRPHAELSPGPHVRLEITDNGCGIDEATLPRIFEPFFTTKPVGEGTGLGLSVVHSVVRGHHGAIAVRSKLGAGTTFEIFLPVHVTAPAPATRAPTQLPRGCGERILIVDDERSVANSGQLILERLGYRPTVFTSPEQALAHFQNYPDDFDAVIADYQMPQMTGLALASKVLTLRPNLPILIASGYAGSLTSESLAELGIAGLIQKPISLDQLASAVARLFASSRSSSRPPIP